MLDHRSDGVFLLVGHLTDAPEKKYGLWPPASLPVLEKGAKVKVPGCVRGPGTFLFNRARTLPFRVKNQPWVGLRGEDLALSGKRPPRIATHQL